MANWTVTKSFHQDGEGHLRGDDVVETISFENFEAADAYGLDINARHNELPYHIASCVLDGRNFIFFDKSEIWEAHQLDMVEWRDAA